jgi:hypothetical protein
MRLDQAGALYFGAFLKRPPEVPSHQAPLDAATNTGQTVTLSSSARDYICRGGLITYQLDRLSTFGSGSLQTSPGVVVKGAQQALWTSAVIANGTWYWQAKATAFGIGAGPAFAAQSFGAPTHNFVEQFGALFRSLYVLGNRGVQALPSPTYRGLELVANRGLQALPAITYRALTLLDARGIQALAVLMRALTNLESYTNDPEFPWLLSISPTQQYRNGQVSLVGDGFGANAAAWTSSVLLGAILEVMGVVAWQTRSPGLWPCNAVSPNVFSPAITVTVPADAVSGLVKVEETT